MSNDQFLLNDKEYREESLKTLKMRRRLYVGAFIIVLAACLWLLGQVLGVLSSVVGILIWTTIIVFCLKGIVNKLEDSGMNRLAGTCIAYLVMFACLALVVVVMFTPVLGVGDQFKALVESIPAQVSAIQSLLNDITSQYADLLANDQVDAWIDDAIASLGAWASSFASVSADGLITFGSTAINSLLILGFSLVVAFWMLMDLPQLGREIKRLAGPEHADDLNIIYLTGTRVMGGYIRGTLIQCFLIGLACGIGFAVMGIPSAAALGLITGLLNIIPVVGPWFGGALAGIVGIFVSPFIAILAFVYTVVVQQLIYTFVSPKVLGNSCDIHPALVILALMAGAGIGTAMNGLMGSLVGALASIPAVAFLKSIFVYYFEKKTGRIIVAEDGVVFKGEPAGEEANPVADATGKFVLPDLPEIDDKQPKHSKS